MAEAESNKQKVYSIPCYLFGQYFREAKMDRLPPMPDYYFADIGKMVRFQCFERYDGSFYYEAMPDAR